MSLSGFFKKFSLGPIEPLDLDALFPKPPEFPMTDFEEQLLEMFEHGKGYKRFSSLLVAVQKPLGDADFQFVKVGYDVKEAIEALDAVGRTVVMSFDLSSPKTLPEQFPDWLPGTINYPSIYVVKPFSSLPQTDNLPNAHLKKKDIGLGA